MASVIPPNKPVLLAALAIGALWFISQARRAQAGVPGTQRGYGLPTTTGAINSAAASPIDQLLTKFPSLTSLFAPRVDPTTGSVAGVPGQDARSTVRAGDSYYGAGDAGNNVGPQEAFRSAEYSDPNYSYDAVVVNPTVSTADSFTAADYGEFF